MLNLAGLIFLAAIYIFYLSILFRFDFRINQAILAFINLENALGIVLLKIFCFRIFRLYRGMWRYTSLWDMLNIIKANTLASLILILMIYFSSGFDQISRSLFIIDYILCTGFIGISRLGIRMFFSHIVTFIKSSNRSKIKKAR